MRVGSILVTLAVFCACAMMKLMGVSSASTKRICDVTNK